MRRKFVTIFSDFLSQLELEFLLPDCLYSVAAASTLLQRVVPSASLVATTEALDGGTRNEFPYTEGMEPSRWCEKVIVATKNYTMKCAFCLGYPLF